MAGGLGFFAGGLADSLSAGLSRNQQYDFQQKEIALQQQGQQLAQQRFEMSRIDGIISDASEHLRQTIDAAKVAGEDPKTIMSAIGGMFDQYRNLTTSAGRGQGFADAQLATWMAQPPSTVTEKAHAAAKESPSLVALRKSQADPFGLEAGTGTGTVAPPGSNTFQPGEQITGVDAQDSPPARVAQDTPTATAGETPEEAKGNAFLASIPNQRLAAAVKAVANYEVNPNTFLSRGTMASRAQFLGLVQQYAESRGQTYDQTNFTAKNKAIQGFATRVQAISLADSELRNSLPILRAANQAVSRTQYKTINAIIEAAQEHTGGTAVVQLGEALNTTVNLYARAINPTGGKPTVNDLNHANEVLQKAWSQGQIEAGIQQLLQEVDAAKASLPAARNEILGILSGESAKGSSKPPQYKFNPQTGELE